MLERKIAPAITQAVNFDVSLKPYTASVLDNGVTVYAFNAPSQEVLMVELIFSAGNCFENQNIVAATTNFLLKNGTTKKTAYQINEAVDFYGAHLNRNCYNEYATVTLHSLSKHLPELLPIMTEIITESIFLEEELKTYQQNQKQRLSINLTRCDFVANRLIDEQLYGTHHPYGKYTSAAQYDELDTALLKEFYKQYYINGHCKIFIAGNLPTNYESLLNQAFGQLPLQKEPPTFSSSYNITPLHNYHKKNIVNDANGVQAAIRIASNFPNRHHPDFSKVQVLNSVFGGFFGSRLMSNIREDKGYTYGIHSYLQNHIQQSAFMISTEAGRDVAAATIDEVYKEMEILRNTLIDDEELSLVKNYMIGSLLGDVDGCFQIISRWRSYILNNLPANYFENAVNTIKNVTALELQALANVYLQPQNFYELTVV